MVLEQRGAQPGLCRWMRSWGQRGGAPFRFRKDPDPWVSGGVGLSCLKKACPVFPFPDGQDPAHQVPAGMLPVAVRKVSGSLVWA